MTPCVRPECAGSGLFRLPNMAAQAKEALRSSGLCCRKTRLTVMCLCLIGNPVQYFTASRQSRQWGEPSHAEQQSCRTAPCTDSDLGALSRYWHSYDAMIGHKADKSVLTPPHCHAEHDRHSAWVSSTGKLRHEGCLKGLSSSALVPGCIRCCGHPRHAHASRRHPPPNSGRHH